MYEPAEEPQKHNYAVFHTGKHIIGDAVEQVRNYDLMSAVMICLGDEDDKTMAGC